MIKTLLFLTGLLISIFWIHDTFYKEKEKSKIVSSVDIDENAPPCLKTYYYIEKYSKLYGVPRNYAFGIARYETGYQGPYHWNYKPRQTSYAKAYGAMQIQVPTANDFTDSLVTHKDLLNDLELNIKTSMQILAHLKKRCKSWPLAFGAYHTGKPCIDEYALDVYEYKPNF